MSLSGVPAYVASGLQDPAGGRHHPQGVTNPPVSRILWKEEPQRVIAP